MFYEWREALKSACKQKEMIGGQMVHHNRRVKQGCMKEWKKFTLKSRAEKHRSNAVTSKVCSSLCVAVFFCCSFLSACRVVFQENVVCEEIWRTVSRLWTQLFSVQTLHWETRVFTRAFLKNISHRLIFEPIKSLHRLCWREHVFAVASEFFFFREKSICEPHESLSEIHLGNVVYVCFIKL